MKGFFSDVDFFFLLGQKLCVKFMIKIKIQIV